MGKLDVTLQPVLRERASQLEEPFKSGEQTSCWAYMLGISMPSGRLVDCEQAMELQDGPWYRAVVTIHIAVIENCTMIAAFLLRIAIHYLSAHTGHCKDYCAQANYVLVVCAPRHPLQQFKGWLPLHPLLTCTDGCTPAYPLRCQKQLIHHLLQQSKGCLPLYTLLMRTDRSTATDHIRQ